MDNEQKQKMELNAVTKKVLVIFGLTLALILPLGLVENQIINRREYEKIAQKEVAKGWGENVVFGSPTLWVSENSIAPTTIETTIDVDSKEKERLGRF